eukprot:2087176-Rhodomonas_salina.1
MLPHFPESHSKREDVALRGVPAAGNDLRRHPPHRAAQPIVDAQGRDAVHDQSEVRNLHGHLALVCLVHAEDPHVAARKVAVDDAVLCQMGHALTA